MITVVAVCFISLRTCASATSLSSAMVMIHYHCTSRGRASLLQVLLCDVVDDQVAPGRSESALLAAELPLEMDGHVLAQDADAIEELVTFGTGPLHRLCSHSLPLVETGIVADLLCMRLELLVAQIALQTQIDLVEHVAQISGFGLSLPISALPFRRRSACSLLVPLPLCSCSDRLCGHRLSGWGSGAVCSGDQIAAGLLLCHSQPLPRRWSRQVHHIVPPFPRLVPAPRMQTAVAAADGCERRRAGRRDA